MIYEPFFDMNVLLTQDAIIALNGLFSWLILICFLVVFLSSYSIYIIFKHSNLHFLSKVGK